MFKVWIKSSLSKILPCARFLDYYGSYGWLLCSNQWSIRPWMQPNHATGCLPNSWSPDRCSWMKAVITKCGPKTNKIRKKWDLKLETLGIWLGQSSESSPPPVDLLTSAPQVHGACMANGCNEKFNEKIVWIWILLKVGLLFLAQHLAIPVASLPNQAARSQPPHWEVALEIWQNRNPPTHSTTISYNSRGKVRC